MVTTLPVTHRRGVGDIDAAQHRAGAGRQPQRAGAGLDRFVKVITRFATDTVLALSAGVRAEHPGRRIVAGARQLGQRAKAVGELELLDAHHGPALRPG